MEYKTVAECKSNVGVNCHICTARNCIDCRVQILLDMSKKWVCNTCVKQIGSIERIQDTYNCFMICEVCDEYTANSSSRNYKPHVKFIEHDGYRSLQVCNTCYLFNDWKKLLSFQNHPPIYNKIVESNNTLALKMIQETRENKKQYVINNLSQFILNDIAKVIYEYYAHKIIRRFEQK